GTFEGAAMLAAPHPLLLHNTGDKFPTDGIRSAYQAVRADKKLRTESAPLSSDKGADSVRNFLSARTAWYAERIPSVGNLSPVLCRSSGCGAASIAAPSNVP